MTSSTLITDYLQEGLAADMPVSLTLPAGAVGFYYQTDTMNGYMWDQSTTTWVQVMGTLPAGPTIVQNGASANDSTAGSVTLGTAPVSGNLLVAFANGASSVNAASGWTQVGPVGSSGAGYSAAFWKIAGASESATQTVLNASQSGSVGIFEVNNAAISYPTNDHQSSASPSFATFAQRAGGILLGAFMDETGGSPTGSITGATADGTSHATSHAIALFHNTTVTAGNNTVSGTNGAGSVSTYEAGVIVY